MAITTMDELVEGMIGGQEIRGYKTLFSAIPGTFLSLWALAGKPCAGATPTTGAGDVPTKATAGAIPFTNPGSGNSYLQNLWTPPPTNTGWMQLILYDRLVQTSGLSGTSIVSQTVNSTAITRPDANGEGTELWIEIYTAIGGTERTLTVTYTNSAGTGSRTGTVLAAGTTGTAGYMYPVTLQSGDTGVKSVQSVQWSASTGTAGDFGITILRRIATLQTPSQTHDGYRNVFSMGMPRIYDDACLAFMLSADSAVSATGHFNFLGKIVQG